MKMLRQVWQVDHEGEITTYIPSGHRGKYICVHESFIDLDVTYLGKDIVFGILAREDTKND